MQRIDNPREHGQIGGSGGKVGTGSRIPLMTLKAIYASCIYSLSDPNAPIGDCEYNIP